MNQMQTFHRPDGSKVTHEVLGDWTRLVSKETLDVINNTVRTATQINIRDAINVQQITPKKIITGRKRGRQPGSKVIDKKVYHYGSKAKKDLAPGSTLLKTTKKRPCMSCKKPFDSEGAHNRLCNHCRHLSDY